MRGDIRSYKAFDTIGYEHIKHTLQSLPIPFSLRSLVSTLITTSSTKINVNQKLSKSNAINRGVPQGSPLSPTIFNLCQDFILKQITDQNIADIHRFQITPELENIIAKAFADNNVIVAKDVASAVTVVDMMNQMFIKI